MTSQASGLEVKEESTPESRVVSRLYSQYVFEQTVELGHEVLSK